MDAVSNQHEWRRCHCNEVGVGVTSFFASSGCRTVSHILQPRAGCCFYRCLSNWIPIELQSFSNGSVSAAKNILAVLASAPEMPRFSSISGSISAFWHPRTIPAHQARFLTSFHIQPSSLPTLRGRWNALSLDRPPGRPFSQSSIIGTHNTPSTGLISEKLSRQNSHSENAYHGHILELNLAGKVHIVTGGAQGLGLSLAEGLVEAGSTGLSSTLYRNRIIN